MKRIGQILHQARLDMNLSLSSLEAKTKIKAVFIDAIEKEKWETLPPFPTVLGFVKSLASALSLEENAAVAILKRDYPPKKLRILPKPDLKSRFIWSPRITFAIGISMVLIVLFGYLITQYVHFVSPPSLVVESPKDNQVVTENIQVFGTTDTDAKITVNDQPVIVSDDGKFSVNIEVVNDTKEIVVQASSRSGKTTTVSRKIQSGRIP